MRPEQSLSAGRRAWTELELGQETVSAQPITGFDSLRLEVGVALPIDARMESTISLSHTWDDFHADFPGLAEPRQDRRTRLSVSLWHKDIKVGGFMPQLTISATRQNGNEALYRFDRVETALGLARAF